MSNVTTLRMSQNALNIVSKNEILIFEIVSYYVGYVKEIFSFFCIINNILGSGFEGKFIENIYILDFSNQQR